MRDSRETVEQPSRVKRVALLSALFIIVLGVYAPSVMNQYALDDPLLAKAKLPGGDPNPMVAELRPLSDYFAANYWEGDHGTKTRLYRPVTILSYALTNELQGGVDADPRLEAVPHHLINVLLHAWSVLLAFSLIARLTSRFYPALLGAAVFGLHALHSETVAGIVGRAELFGFCFGAQALLFAVSSARCCRAPSHLHALGAGVLLFMAFASKESALAWLPLFFVYAFARAHTGGPRLNATAAMRLLAIGLPPLILFLVLRQFALDGIENTPAAYVANPLWHEGMATRIQTGVMLWGYGLWKCLWPVGLTSDYGPVTFDLAASTFDLRFLLAGAILLAWTAAGIAFRKTRPLLLVSCACFFGFGFMVSNVPFPIGTIFAERLYFTPTLAIAFLVAWGSTLARRRWMVPLVGLWLVISATVIYQNNGAWRDDTNRLIRDASTNRRCVRNLDALARLRRGFGDFDEAEKLWKEVLALDPGFLNAINEYGNFLADRKRYKEAERMLVRAVGVPLRLGRTRHMSFCNLARLYRQMERPDRVVEQVRLAWREESAFEDPHEPLIVLTMQVLPTTEASTIASELERRRPEDPASQFLRGLLAFDAREYEVADHTLLDVIRARPRHASARYYRAITLRFLNRTIESRALLQELTRDPTVPKSIRTQAIKSLQIR